MEELRQAILALDIKLTGKDRDAKHNLSQHSDDDLRDYFLTGQNYYLADGGYSRIYINPFADEVPHLMLASESRQEVKEAWAAVVDERQALEAIAIPMFMG